MEDFVLAALINELRPEIVGLTLEAFQQSGMTELVLTAARGPSRVIHLLLSLGLAEPKLYCQENTRRTDREVMETPFTSRLMKIIADSEIKDLTKQPYDRVVKITISNPYRPAEEIHYLYVELITQGANLFLVEAGGQVLEAFHSDFDRRRALSIGSPYVLRDQPAKQDPQSCTEPLFYEIMGDLGQPAWMWAKKLTSGFLGLSPTIAREIGERSGEDRRQLWPAFQQVIAAIYEHAPEPRIYTVPAAANAAGEVSARDTILSTIELRHLRDGSETRYATVNEAVRTYYERMAEWRAYQNLLAEHQHSIQARRVKLERLHQHLVNSRREFDDAETLKRKGELLLANLYRLQPQVRTEPHGKPLSVTVENYYEDPPTTLELVLDPTLSLQANAERYFQRYRKAKRGLQTLEKKIPAVQSELDRLRQHEDALRAARTGAELQDRVKALTLIKPSTRKRIEIQKSRQPVEEISVRRFMTTDRLEVLIGRNRRENDHLTFRVAAPHDVWMHAADYPGSHVVIRNPQKIEVPERSIREAAQVAAYYSQARKNGKVLVHHTLRKFVHKPKNAAPGLVTLSHFKSITVEPKKAMGEQTEG